VTATLSDHRVVDRADAVEHAFEIDVDCSIPDLLRRRMIAEERQRHDAGVVDQHVNAAVPVDREAHDLIEVGASRDVTSHAERFPARINDRLGSRRRQVASTSLATTRAPILVVISATTRPNPPPAPVITITLPSTWFVHVPALPVSVTHRRWHNENRTSEGREGERWAEPGYGARHLGRGAPTPVGFSSVWSTAGCYPPPAIRETWGRRPTVRRVVDLRVEARAWPPRASWVPRRVPTPP